MWGNRMFLQSGVEVMIIEALSDDRMLVDEFLDMDDEYVGPRGSPFIVNKSALFEQAPVASVNKEVQALQAKKELLLEEIRRIEYNVDTVKRSAQAITLEYQKWNELRDLNLFVQKKITHYVEFHYSDLKIVEFKDEKCEGSRNELKLLTLFGNAKGDLQWKLNAYNDGSGSNYEVIPCLSYEDALLQAQEWLNCKVLAEEYISDTSIRNAQAYGLKISSAYLERRKQARKNQIQANIDRSLVEVAKLQKEMEGI
jgi:hypothetical protein